MHRIRTAAPLVILAAACTANAYEFRVQFVERLGSFDSVLQDNRLITTTGIGSRVRIQFGVFDDAEGPAPLGGYFGWNMGSIAVGGIPGNSDEFRSPGRLVPFTAAPAEGGANGIPAGDPFEAITGVDNTLGPQNLAWNFGGPMPQPRIRGFNTWVSTYEITVVPNVSFQDYTITFSGSLMGVESWMIFGEPVPPTEQEPGSVNYVPVVDDPRQFSVELIVTSCPGPGTVAAFALGTIVLNRRRR
jgi:hypothetical protein